MNEDDDITLDSEEGIDDSVVSEEHMGDAVKKLKEKVKVAEAKAKEHLDNWQRAQAEFVNLRKRDEESKQDFIKFAKADMIAQIIPVLDSLDLAIGHGHKDMEAVRSQFMQILKSNGLEEMNPLGQTFDPGQHEAIAMMPTAKEEEDHKVLDVLQKGYALNGKVIRPAKVRIGEYKA